MHPEIVAGNSVFQKQLLSILSKSKIEYYKPELCPEFGCVCVYRREYYDVEAEFFS